MSTPHHTKIQLSDGKLLVAEKQVTGYSNEEEQLAELDHQVPFLTETELKARGAVYVKADAPWAPFAIKDQRLITGQNPASGGAVAEKQHRRSIPLEFPHLPAGRPSCMFLNR
jgi:putative intracellular protease/amidase